jgi:zinc protease
MQMPKIPVDTAVRIGKLSNGLTYYIRHNNYPEHRANFYIAQRVGSIQENDDQRGLAHFLEHMAFNGSEHFKGNNLIEYTRSLGVGFGDDLNAYTSIDQTVYRVCNVPTTRESSIDSCIIILKDWSNGLSLEKSEIQKERGVIHEEWRLRTDASTRMFERNLETLYPGSKYGKRMPIGKMEIVDNFAPEVLRNYYKKWYRPDNQGLIIVGDVDVNKVEQKIKDLFGGIKVPANAAKVVDEPVPDNAQPIIVVDKDKEQQYNLVEVMFKHDAIPDSQKTSQLYLIENFAKQMVCDMLNTRFTEKSQEPDCPFLQAICFDGQYIFAKTKDAFSFYALPKEGKTEDAVKAAMCEVLRAAKFGFTATEYERAKAEYLSQLEKRYTNRNKVKNDSYGNEYRDNFLANEPIPSITDEYTIMKQFVPQVPVLIINSLIKEELVGKTDSNLVVLNFNIEKDGATYPTVAGLKKAIDEARTADLKPYVDNVKNEPLISKLPAKGSIKKEVENKVLGFKELTLSNGVKVVLKKTDFKDDQVLMSAYSKGGKSYFDKKDYDNAQALSAVISFSGLGDFDNTELQKALAGKQVNVDFDIDKKLESISGSSTPKDLETMFQLTYLKFTNIKKDQKSFDNLMQQFKAELGNKKMSPESAFSDSVKTTLHSHQAIDAPFELDTLDGINYDRCLQLAKERLANAADFTFYFVGNFNEDSIRPLIEQYIATLPATGAKEEFKDVFNYPKGKVVNQFNRKMETPKAIAEMFWYNDNVPYTLDNMVKASAAGQVLDMVYLKKIREDASAAYSAAGNGAITYYTKNRTTAVLLGYCPMKPEKSDIALKIMRDEVVNLGKNIDSEMLSKVKEYLLKHADNDAKDNNHWVDVLSDYELYGVDKQTEYKKDVEALTPASVSKFVNDYILKGGSVQVVMLPDASKK